MEIIEFKDYPSTETPFNKHNLNRMQKNLLTYKYTQKITANIDAGTAFTIPCNYKVGQDVLDVYLNGDRLIKTTSEHARTL